MKVIGAGVGRCGTMSLKEALTQLGFGPCFHMIDLLQGPEMLPPWRRALDGERIDWTEALAGWESTVDWPGCMYFDQMAEDFPDAKVLLNVRDPDSWYASVNKTIRAAFELHHSGEGSKGDKPLPRDVMEHNDELLWTKQFEGRWEDEEFAKRKMLEHNERVKATIPAERLLVYELGSGWAPLCEFLEVPVPETPYPQANDTNSFRAMFGLPPVEATAPVAATPA